ncbi:MAG TPA: tetratricopeptide repeat protein [Peptococcaceae bacterium]|nr:tetratricopeptide repeat protein [Peptococcaceae bacterium]
MSAFNSKGLTIRKGTFLLAVLLVLVLVLGAGYLFTPKLLAKSIEKQEQVGNKNSSLVLKERLIRFFPASEEARRQVFALADIFLQQENRVLIGPNFTSGGAGTELPLTAGEVIGYLGLVAEAQKEAIWKYNCYEKLAELYKAQGDYALAEETFRLALEGFSQGQNDFRAAEINGKLAALYLETGQGEKALAIIEESLRKYPEQLRGQFLCQQGDVYFQLEDYTKAEESYREALAQAEKDWESYRHVKSRLEQLAGFNPLEQKGQGKVKGEIFKGSEPLPNVLVYLISEREYDGRMNHLEGVAAQPAIKTEQNGSFEFEGVAPGRYFLVLGVLPEDLEGLGRFKGLEVFTVEAGKTRELKYVLEPRVLISEPVGRQSWRQGEELEIKWEEVPQASSYNLYLTLELGNGYGTRVYRENLRGNSYLFNPQGLNLREMTFTTWDENGLNPAAILGCFYPGAKIYFLVEALDSNGKPISDSEGYVLQHDANYPSVKVEESAVSPLSPEDKLVLAKKYDEALTAYESRLASNPSDLEALLSLARIYRYYDLIQGRPGTITSMEYVSQWSKALEYYRQLLELTRERFIVEEAASTAVQAGDERLALELFEEIAGELAENSFWYHVMGELYFKTGQPSKALPYYLKFLEGQKEFRDLGPVMVMLYQEDFKGALKLLQEKGYSESRRYTAEGQAVPPADVKVLLENLQSYSAGTASKLSEEEFKKYLLEIINIDGQNRYEQVKAWQAKVRAIGDNDVLVRVLLELAQDRL